MKKNKMWLIIGFICSVFFVIGVDYGLAKVELGGDVRMRYNSFENTDYDVHSSSDSAIFSTQRTRVYFRGDLDEDVWFNIKVQSNGYWGQGSPLGLAGNYEYTGERESFNPWVLNLETAYLKFVQIEKLPIDLTVGRQPIKYGDGLLLDDNKNGFDALRAVWRLPYNLELEALSIKGRESSRMERKQSTDPGPAFETWKYVPENKDADVYGTLIRWLPLRKKIEFYFISETDRLFSDKFLKDKFFYGIRLEEALKEGIDYKIEYIVKQAGKKKIFKEIFSDGMIKYDGYALHAAVSAYTNARYLGPTRAKAGFLQATGSLDTQDKNNFNPAYAIKTNDYGELYFGEYYSDVSTGIANRKIINFGVGISPFKKTTIDLNYYIFDAYSKTIQGVSDIGEELDIVLFYRYSSQVKLRLGYAIFMPGDASKMEATSATKLLGEMLVSF